MVSCVFDFAPSQVGGWDVRVVDMGRLSLREQLAEVGWAQVPTPAPKSIRHPKFLVHLCTAQAVFRVLFRRVQNRGPFLLLPNTAKKTKKIRENVCTKILQNERLG